VIGREKTGRFGGTITSTSRRDSDSPWRQKREKFAWRKGSRKRKRKTSEGTDGRQFRGEVGKKKKKAENPGREELKTSGERGWQKGGGERDISAKSKS